MNIYDTMEETSVVSTKLVPIVEHTYAQCKEVHALCGHSGECFLLGYKVSSCKGYKQGSTWLLMKIVDVIGL
jgi:hypothetical protein